MGATKGRWKVALGKKTKAREVKAVKTSARQGRRKALAVWNEDVAGYEKIFGHGSHRITYKPGDPTPRNGRGIPIAALNLPKKARLDSGATRRQAQWSLRRARVERDPDTGRFKKRGR